MPTSQPNILLITADDMNWDAVGCFGCPVEGTTPNIDRLACEGVRFEHAHVTIAVCQPSRSALMTGRYPHRSGGYGFHNLRLPDVPIMPDLLRKGGYRVGILGKHGHSTPYKEFEWDMTHDRPELGQGRNPSLYKQHAREFVEEAQAGSQPFFLMLNSHDPHRPFYGNDNQEWYADDTQPRASVPSRTFTPDEVVIPGFLAEDEQVRLEISEYYNSVRRCDDTVGGALDVLEETGCAGNTIVVFFSDNGMAFPFAKTNCYLHSTRTPWVMRWPGTVKAGRVDDKHFVSGIDLLPTLLEAAGVEAPENIDGTSFLPVLRGEEQQGRELVFTQFHQTAARNNYPMRAVQNARFGYLFNPWSNGTREFRNESQNGRTFTAMQQKGESDPVTRARVDLFVHRVPEELYDFEHDPDALHNLIDSPAYADMLDELRGEMEAWMERTEDPALEAFRHRDDLAARESFMREAEGTLGGSSQLGVGVAESATNN